MEERPLHPNLARVAASYDEVMLAHAEHRIDDRTALERALALVARDDNGVRWRLNPATGSWERQARSGEWVAAAPPVYGLATPTPHDFSPSAALHPARARVELNAVDEGVLYSDFSLAGSTRLDAEEESPRPPAPRRGLLIVALVLVAVVVVALASALG